MINLIIIGCVQGAEQFYILNLRDGSAYITRSDINQWVVLASAPYLIKDDIWYDLKAEFNGSTITMYINNQLLISAQDSSYNSGGVGLRCAEFTVASFDDFTVKNPSNP
jgi:hypothetical protein